MSFRPLLCIFLLVAAPLLAGGCSSGTPGDDSPADSSSNSGPSDSGPSAGGSPARGENSAAAAEMPDEPEAEPSGPFRYGNMLEPFDPPPLEELLASHEWVDRPVLDSMVLMREHQATLPPPKLTPAEALDLRNESPEDNELIVDSLGRLAPVDGKGVDFNAEITLVSDGDIKSTNPLLASSTADFDYSGLTRFGLFSFDWNFKKYASSDSVVSWRTSEDRTVDIVVLRDDLTWSDGKPITAHDVEFSFNVIMTEQVIIPAERTGTDQIKYVKAYDDHTVAYFHKEALATNDSNMNFSVIPKHIYEETIPEDPTMARSAIHSRLEDNPVVGGSYTLEKRTRGQEFVLARRDSYYMYKGKQVRDRPYFKRVRYKVIEDRNTALLALKSGQVDTMMLLAEQWQGQSNDDEFYLHNTKASGVEWVSFHFCWNLETPYFDDVRVRRAMSYAMDYEELLDTLLYGLHTPCRGTFHPTSWMFPKNGPEPYHQDFDKAEELLDEAGWTDSDGDGIRDKMVNGRRIPFEFTLDVVNYESRIRIATLLKECLDAIGIICHVKPTEFTVLIEKQRTHKFQAAFAGWGTGADPDTTANIFKTGEGRNYGFYSNTKVDALFEKARREFDDEKRAEIYGQIHMLLWEDQPYTWLYNRNSFYGFNKKLRGYNFSPRGPFLYGPGFSSVYTPLDVP